MNGAPGGRILGASRAGATLLREVEDERSGGVAITAWTNVRRFMKSYVLWNGFDARLHSQVGRTPS
jgi:hypothetical protein